MSIDLAVDNELSSTGEAVKDQDGNSSQLYLSTDNVSVGSANAQRRLDVFGNDSVSGALAAANASGGLRVNIWVSDTNSEGRIDCGRSGGNALRINDGGGSVSLGGNLSVAGSDVQFSGLSDLPASGTVDLVVDSQGNVATQTSSKSFKKKIERLKDDFHKILSLEPVSFVDTASDENRIGYIAEDLHEKELGSLVAYDSEGRPLSVHYKMLPVYLLEVLKRQQTLIEGLKQQLAGFGHRVECLESTTG